MPGGRTRGETKGSSGDIVGLHLCEACKKSNEERLKSLFITVESRPLVDEVGEMNESLKEIKRYMSVLEGNEKMLREQRDQLVDLRASLESFGRESIDKIEETRNSGRKWSELFANGVESLSTDVKSVQHSVEVTGARFDIAAERQRRRNNIVIFNMQETESTSRAGDKIDVIKMLEDISDLKLEKEILDVYRLGRRNGSARPRPVLIKFENFSAKNIIMENAPRLRKKETTKNVILNNDLSDEDRRVCRELLAKKKEEIGGKEDINRWIFRIRGQPGEFRVLAYKKQNL